MVLLLLLSLLLCKSNIRLPLLSRSHINATVYPRGYFSRRGKYLPLGVNLMHINGAIVICSYHVCVVVKLWYNQNFICINDIEHRG